MRLAKNQKNAAQQLGVSPEIVKVAGQQGAPGFNANGTINLDDLEPWLEEHPELIEEFSDVPNFMVERALHERAKRQKAELGLEVAKKALIPHTLVRRTLIRFLSVSKTRLLNIATATGQRYALEEDPVAIEQDLSERILDALEELHRCEWISVNDIRATEPEAPKPKPKAKAKRKAPRRRK